MYDNTQKEGNSKTDEGEDVGESSNILCVHRKRVAGGDGKELDAILAASKGLVLISEMSSQDNICRAGGTCKVDETPPVTTISATIPEQSGVATGQTVTERFSVDRVQPITTTTTTVWWAKLNIAAEAFRTRYASCMHVKDTTFPGQRGSLPFFTKIPPMPSELDVAMMLWPLFNVSRDTLSIEAMLESKVQYLQSWMERSKPTDDMSWSCRFLRIVWRTYHEIATSNNLSACYDTCVSARNGVCEETHNNGAIVGGCAENTDATDCSCAPPWVRYPRGNNTGKRTVLTLWASDYHTGPVGDYKMFFPREVAPRIGGNVHVEFIDQSFASYCGLEGTCATPEMLPVVNRNMTWVNCPNQREYQERVFDGLKTFAPFATVDAFVVALPVCAALTWVPFNKSIIGVEATHWQDGRLIV